MGLSALAIASLVAATAQFPDLGGRLPRIDLPGLESLLKREDPLTTSLDNADFGLPFLDGWDPGDYKLLTEQDRRGRIWKLQPGHYVVHLRSYCARAGTPGPWVGDGMVHGAWSGSAAEVIRKVLQRADLMPEIEQGDVQVLIWALLSRAKPSQMRGRAREAALKLLTEEERRKLDGLGLDFLEDRIMNQLMGRFDQALRPLLEAENKIRGIVYRANQPFEELERLAVLPPLKNVRGEVPVGRWVWKSEGYAIRYEPHSFTRLTAYIVVPQPFKIVRDSRGRIVRLEGPPGYVSEVEYDDSIPGQRCPIDEGLTAYKFKRIQLTSPEHTATFENVGWTYVGVPRRKSYKLPFMNLYTWRTTTPPWQGGFWDTIERWQERAERAQEARERFEQARQNAERLDRIMRGDASDEDFLDTEHYREGIEAATSGDPSERAEWIAEHHARQNEALLHAINVLETLPDGTDVDPSDRVALPGHRGAQRIVAGTRTW